MIACYFYGFGAIVLPTFGAQDLIIASKHPGQAKFSTGLQSRIQGSPFRFEGLGFRV